jgi:hypothetical protein
MKFIKVFRILAATLLPVILAVTIPAAPATAAGEVISLANSQGTSISQGGIGQVVNITGSGFFAANNTGIVRGVNILFGRYPIITNNYLDYSASIFQNVLIAPLNDDGTFRYSFTVPTTLVSGSTRENVGRGSYYVYLTYYYPGFNPGDVAANGTSIIQMVPFNIVVGAITISPDNGPVGTAVNVNGTYFGGTEGYTIYYDSSLSNFSGNVLTTSNGTLGPAKITIPSGTAGQHSIIVSGNNSGTTANLTFTVKPKITIVPASGSPSTMINILGTGFGAQQDAAITFGGDTLTPTKTDTGGSFAYIFGALKKAAASYDIVATDSKGNSEDRKSVV